MYRKHPWSSWLLYVVLIAGITRSVDAQSLDYPTLARMEAAEEASVTPSSPLLAKVLEPGSDSWLGVRPGQGLSSRRAPAATRTAVSMEGSSQAEGASGGSSGDSEGLFFADNGEGYQGGRGLITLEGISGMFLNPTSGTLPRGSLTAQYCVGILEKNDDTEYQHTAFASYGLTDWFEIGLLGRITNPSEGSNIGGGGPLARLRILKDSDWLPELSIGGMLREGNKRIDKRTAFAAVSKRVVFERNKLFLKSLRFHGGFRYLWQESEVAEANGDVFYGGVEVEFPYDVWIVGELSNNADVFAHQPYSVGMQWRPTQVVGLSVAGVQTGGEDQISLYVGIGATLDL